MNNTNLIRFTSRTGRLRYGIVGILVLGIAVIFLAASCSKPKAEGPLYVCPMHHQIRSHDPNARCSICGMRLEEVEHYTCTMHPSVVSHDPDGKCPICSMNLVPVFKQTTGTTNSAAMDEHPGQDHAGMPPGKMAEADDGMTNAPTEFVVPANRQQQIGVNFATVARIPLRETLRTVGMVVYDKQRRFDLVARVDGYTQKLLISSRGDLVEKDQPLMTIYSPDLLTAQEEFLDLLRKRDQARTSGPPGALESADKLIESAKRRLMLWNVTTNQIAELEQTRAAKDTLTFHSPCKGVVQDLEVEQGRRVMTGDRLAGVIDLSTVWVWAEFYQDELPLLKAGLPVTITSSSLPGAKFSGKISVVDPFLNAVTRTGRVRVEVENPDLQLRPDMYVDLAMEAGAGEGLAVPVAAVMPTGRHNLVFVDKGGGRLEPRFVELGRKFGTNYAVNGGLQEGERVVDSANFLIDAEAKIQGALKTW